MHVCGRRRLLTCSGCDVSRGRRVWVKIRIRDPKSFGIWTDVSKKTSVPRSKDLIALVAKKFGSFKTQICAKTHLSGTRQLGVPRPPPDARGSARCAHPKCGFLFCFFCVSRALSWFGSSFHFGSSFFWFLPIQGSEGSFGTWFGPRRQRLLPELGQSNH